MSDNTTIQGLWIGPRLSALERLSIASFLANGHAFHLYAYDPIDGVPEGARVLPAGAVLPRSRIFRYTEARYGRRPNIRSTVLGPKKGSYGGFANLFRYKLLLETGGWWVDLDTVCLRPLDFAGEYGFSSEMDKGAEVADLAAIKVPARSALAEYLFQESDNKSTEELYFGETGPHLLGRAIAQFGLQQYVQPSSAFCPIDCGEWETVLHPGGDSRIGPEAFAVHLWNEMWRRNGRDKDAAYPPDCLFERLKSRYRTRRADRTD
jgi:hypothetical protein